MKVYKRRWCAVNYQTGEVLQVDKPMTKEKAIKLFENHNGGNIENFVIKRSLKEI
jgi:hypothetical protein